MHDPLSYPRPGNTKWQFWIKVTLILLPVLVIFAVHGPSIRPDENLKWKSTPETDTTTTPEEIPNIVHFVHLVAPEKERNLDKPLLYFPFRQFIAIYSASYMLSPTAIYIHTNIPKEALPEALNSGNKYVQLIRKLPGVIVNPVEAPTRTSSGLAIPSLPNQSDFVRTAALKKYGGIYLDDDAYLLRDLTPLRQSGFKFIAGESKVRDFFCPGAFLTTPENGMITAYHALQDRTFDGSWGAHAIDLLTTLARDFASIPRAVLVLSPDTFFPMSWMREDMEALYLTHPEEEGAAPSSMEVSSEPVLQSPEGLTKPAAGDASSPEDHDDGGGQALNEYISTFELHPSRGWRRDWRNSYILHGWNNAFKTDMSEEVLEELFDGKDEFITLEYVLARSSNFARAVYPAVRHAVDVGVLGLEREG